MKQLLLLLLLPLAATAQVRYHFGDDRRWSDPRLDDSAWPVAEPGKFPLPIAEGSNGMVWLRYRVTVPPDQSPLAIRLGREGSTCTPGELWVNGVLVGTQGQMPPQPLVLRVCDTNVFDLPIATVQPGGTAIVAWRGWVAPIFVSGVSYAPPVLFRVEIGPRAAMQSRQNEIRGQRRLALEPDFILFVLESLFALAVLALWWQTRTPALFWFAAFVFLWGFYGLVSIRLSLAPGLTDLAFWTFNLAGWLIFYLALIEFMRTVLAPPRWTILALRILSVPWLGITWVPVFWVQDTPLIRLLCSVVFYGGIGLGVLLFLLHMGVAGWFVFRGRPELRGLAITLFLAGLAYLLVDNFGIATTIGGQAFRIQLDNVCTFLVIIAMAYQLLRRLWLDWRKTEELNAEFEAAREMQESLVQLPPIVPGFTVESAYRPASQVGGDFFRILPAEPGSMLLLVGDVSGKGLKAAMTVSAIAGALDNEFSRDPAEVLAHLNRALLQQKRSGFVTCCAALFLPSGEVRVANAGHLAPYVGGKELELPPGLPLGVMLDTTYDIAITSGTQFTFLSDGVIEAENPQRELFGFDRTRALSTQSAETIAEAARAWGQTDDITVVTVRRGA